MTPTALALPDFVIGVRDPWGLGAHEVMFTVGESTDGSSSGGSTTGGVTFGAWSAIPPEIDLAVGDWSGALTGAEVMEDTWHAL